MTNNTMLTMATAILVLAVVARAGSSAQDKYT